jgi:hypothetical protein
MKVTRILAALALVVGFAGTASAQQTATGCARLSWGTCDPYVGDRAITLNNANLLVYSIFGSSDGNVGTDSQIRLRHYEGGSSAVPDAWRFDDSGCQTGSQLGLSTNGLNKACPPYKGTNSLVITQYAIDLDGSAFLRLAITYDNFIPNPATRYTAWLVTFDHSFSAVGPSDPGVTCGGAEKGVNLYLDFAGVLALTGIQLNLNPCNVSVVADPVHGPVLATANGGSEAPVATQPATWGKVKGLYH